MAGGVRNALKKAGLWLIRPSIFNYGRNASNPFGDALDLVGDHQNEAKSIDIDFEQPGPIKAKHKVIVETVQQIPVTQRMAKAREHIAYGFLSLTMAIVSVIGAVYLLNMDLNLDIAFVQVILKKMPWAILIMLAIVMLTLLMYALSHIWRYKLLTSPNTSVPFTDFISNPKLWL